MGSLQGIRLHIKRVYIVLGVSFVLLLISFVFHVIKINKFNALERYDTPDTVSMDVTADIHPRGLLTDSWEKNDAFDGVVINGKIYESTITNNSKSLLVDWKLRVNIKDSCYINNCWNGTVEIHQFSNGEEKVQEVDLRNYNIDDITLDYYLAGQDLLIPLNSGDYFVYLPYEGSDSGEVPLKSTAEFSGAVNIGFILYSLSGENDLSDYVMSYHINKSYFAGTTGMVFLIILPLWALITIVWTIISIIIMQFTSTLYIQNQIIDDMFNLSGTLADDKDYYHKEHSLRVANYSKKIAEAMGMDKQDCQVIYYGAMLHNIGNYAVPERVLEKSTQLSTEDEKLLQIHTIKGAKILENMKSIPQSALAAMYHHEKYDGSGYPMGKSGEDIPLIARIVAVADVYDDMTHERDYRRKYSEQEIKNVFKANSGKWFDPIIVDIFLEIVDSIEE